MAAPLNQALQRIWGAIQGAFPEIQRGLASDDPQERRGAERARNQAIQQARRDEIRAQLAARLANQPYKTRPVRGNALTWIAGGLLAAVLFQRLSK